MKLKKLIFLTILIIFISVLLYYFNLKTNEKIDDFNKEMKNLIENNNLNNFKYCDSNSSLDFIIPDGYIMI